ncbi:La-related protein 6 isoform 2 [Theobroma cacao]|uniref:La-related protein 6 isoform 2 n=1 Tax=Theobroma cacao TaxID=3641 RepID=A0A061GXQ4_THECC|nr:La-related protein 6 isoform 2 [Theobroma cacao]
MISQNLEPKFSCKEGNMSITPSQQSFLTNAFTFTHKPKTNRLSSATFISCRYQSDDHKDSAWRNEKQLAKLAIVTLAAGVLTLGSVGDASAAKTGGRVGGQAFRSSAPRSAPRANSNSRTNIYINPPVAPPLVGPSVAIGVGGGFETIVFFLFLGAVAAVVRRFLGSRDDEDEY